MKFLASSSSNICVKTENLSAYYPLLNCILCSMQSNSVFRQRYISKKYNLPCITFIVISLLTVMRTSHQSLSHDVSCNLMKLSNLDGFYMWMKLENPDHTCAKRKWNQVGINMVFSCLFKLLITITE